MAQNNWLTKVLREGKEAKLTTEFIEERRKLAKEMTAVDERRLALKLNNNAKTLEGVKERARANLAIEEADIHMWKEKGKLTREADSLPRISKCKTKLTAMKFDTSSKRASIEKDMKWFKADLAATREKKAEFEKKCAQRWYLEELKKTGNWVDTKENEEGVEIAQDALPIVLSPSGGESSSAVVTQKKQKMENGQKPSIEKTVKEPETGLTLDTSIAAAAAIWNTKLKQTTDILGKDHWDLMKESEKETRVDTM